MIKKPSNRVADRYAYLFAMFDDKQGMGGPRPLVQNLHPQKTFPGPSGGASQWMVWAMDDSSVAQCFWTFCLMADAKRWKEALDLFAPRVEALFEGDGSMVFERFCKKAAENAVQEDRSAMDRFAKLLSDPVWEPWLAGPMGRAFRDDAYSAKAGWTPPVFQLYMKALGSGWAEAPVLLGSQAVAAMDKWLDHHGGHELDDSKIADWLGAIFECGVLLEPYGACVEEKKLFERLWEKAAPTARESVWAQSLRDGTQASEALERVAGAPCFEKTMIDRLCDGDEDSKAEHQKVDANALILAKSRGWLHPKLFAKAVSMCRGKKLQAQHACLEEHLLSSTSVPSKSRSGPRV